MPMSWFASTRLLETSSCAQVPDCGSQPASTPRPKLPSGSGRVSLNTLDPTTAGTPATSMPTSVFPSIRLSVMFRLPQTAGADWQRTLIPHPSMPSLCWGSVSLTTVEATLTSEP
jgi:hypothetical protein